jgi:hypothetical protein
MACNRPDRSLNPHVTHSDIEVELPSIDGMLAGTMALMTGYAEHQCEQGNGNCRHLIAKKIVSNLFFLASHPQLPGAMAQVLRNLQNHWHTLSALSALEAAAGAEPGAQQSNAPDTATAVAKPQTHAAATALWHAQHTNVQ